MVSLSASRCHAPDVNVAAALSANGIARGGVGRTSTRLLRRHAARRMLARAYRPDSGSRLRLPVAGRIAVDQSQTRTWSTLSIGIA